MDRLFAAVEPALKTKGNGLVVLKAMMREHALAQFETRRLKAWWSNAFNSTASAP